MALTSDYSILDHLLEGCQIIGFDWRYIYVNDATMRQGKQTKETLLGRTMMEMYPGIETTEMFSALQHCMKKRVPQRKENQFIYPDGSKGWFELYIQPIPEGILILSQDISEREQANLKLEEQNQELAFQNEEKEKRAAELVLANQELALQNAEKEKRAAELVLANQEIIRRLQNIQALHRIDRAIAGSLDLDLTLNIVLEQVKTQLNIDAAAVLLLNPHTQILEFTSGLGFRSKTIERSHLRLGEGLSGRAALE
ncbi:MAG: PAS domain-containing protein, partial [Chloroflexi bacterium]|nr:PAS domain-containing protein [Chloroflexota bacterium]